MIANKRDAAIKENERNSAIAIWINVLIAWIIVLNALISDVISDVINNLEARMMNRLVAVANKISCISNK